jgi:hypothetical protein
MQCSSVCIHSEHTVSVRAGEREGGREGEMEREGRGRGRWRARGEGRGRWRARERERVCVGGRYIDNNERGRERGKGSVGGRDEQRVC